MLICSELTLCRLRAIGRIVYAVDVEGTERATQTIKDGKYKYIFPVFAYDKKTGKVLRLLHATLNNNPTLDGILGRLSIGGLRGEVHLLKSCQCDFTYHLAAGDLIERSLQRFSPELAALLCQNGANCTCINGLHQALQINALLRLVGRFEHCAGEHEFPMEARAFVLETVHIHGLAKHTMGSHTMGLGPEP